MNWLRVLFLLASFVLPTLMIGCNQDSTPPAGKMGTGPDTGPPTAGVAKKDRELILKQQREAEAKAADILAKKKKTK